MIKFKDKVKHFKFKKNSKKNYQKPVKQLLFIVKQSKIFLTHNNLKNNFREKTYYKNFRKSNNYFL